MPTLFMIKIGARPKGRLIEQHDIYFGVGEHISDFVEAINSHWSEVKNKWHLDAYRQVTVVDHHRIEWRSTTEAPNANTESALKLFFINLGGYLIGEFEEFHHKLLIVAPTQADAIKQAKQSEFYKRFGFQDKATPFNAASHIDDKQQVDIDEIYNVNELLSGGHLIITPVALADTATNSNTKVDGAIEQEDKSYIGYLSLKKLRALSDAGTL